METKINLKVLCIFSYVAFLVLQGVLANWNHLSLCGIRLIQLLVSVVSIYSIEYWMRIVFYFLQLTVRLLFCTLIFKTADYQNKFGTRGIHMWLVKCVNDINKINSYIFSSKWFYVRDLNVSQKYTIFKISQNFMGT